MLDQRVYHASAVASAEEDFRAAYPEFDPAGTLAHLRRTEYGRLDDNGAVYLDYTGGGLYGAAQIDAHAALLRRSVFGNPHSNNPTSLAATAHVETARRQVLEFFGASPSKYVCIFTANASAALKLVGESYPFEPDGTLALTTDNHNSVNGIREFARRRGTSLVYVPVQAPELRLDRVAMRRAFAESDRSAPNLLAFPAQSNYSGVQHPLDLVGEAHEHGWDVVVDATAFAPTNRFDVGQIGPDFAVASFYKIFGFPTGVGCLLMRRDRVGRMVRPWFAGGTVTIASVGGDGYYLHDDEAAFEDGTVDYLNLPAVTHGLLYIDRIGLDAIHLRVACLTHWLLDALAGLRHRDGRPVVHVLGPTDNVGRGGTVAFVMHDRDDHPIDDRRVEELANSANISMRSGCFCNPGAGEAAHGLPANELKPWFRRSEAVSFLALRDGLRNAHGRVISALRVSMGLATTFADVYRFMCFLQGFVDRTCDDIERSEFSPDRQETRGVTS